MGILQRWIYRVIIPDSLFLNSGSSIEINAWCDKRITRPEYRMITGYNIYYLYLTTLAAHEIQLYFFSNELFYFR